MGEQRAERRRVVTMGSVQEWRRRGRVQVAATQLLINFCETPPRPVEEAFILLEEKCLPSANNVFLEVTKAFKSGFCATDGAVLKRAMKSHMYKHFHYNQMLQNIRQRMNLRR